MLIKKPTLIVIAGPNGSGKTSVTSQLLKHEWVEGAVYVNPDEVAQKRFGDWNSSESVLKAIDFCENLREDCLRERRSLIFETVFSRDDKVDFIRRAKQAGFFVRFFFICTESPTINAARIARRVLDGGHDVPIPKIISRYSKSISNARIIFREVDRSYFYDNSVDNREARLICRFSDGDLQKQYMSDLPDWVKMIVDF